MSNHDCLIWVGNSYFSVEQYLTEAEERGCCRKIPFWPSWMKKGQTRVFLAHHDRFTCPDKGVIFGYFVLDGIGVIFRQIDYEKYNGLLAQLVEHIPRINEKPRADLFRDYLKTCGGVKYAEPLLQFWQELTPYDPLPFKLGKIATNKEDELLDDIIDFLVEFFLACEGSNVNKGSTGYGISTDQTHLEPPRNCLGGQRIGPDRSKTGHPTFYAVDSIARKIDEIFCEKIKDLIKECIKRGKDRKHCLSEQRKKAKSIHKEGHKKGIPEFEAASLAAAESKITPRLPDRLNNCAHMRGEVVVFNDPYPVFKKTPRAAFKGVTQLDGDELLDQITSSYQSKSLHRAPLKLPYYDLHHDVPGKALKKGELISAMAHDLQTSKKFSREVIDWISEEIHTELSEHGVFRWGGVGTLKVKNRKGKKTIEFTPSDRIQKIVHMHEDG